MKKITFLFGVLLLLITFFPNQAKASTLDCYQVDGMAIFGYKYGEWKFIGAIANEYNSDSIANEYGAGSKYNSDSIFNEYGSYGSKYSSYSAFNDYASNPPIIVSDNYKLVGYLTTNDYKTPNINTYEAVACAKNSYSSPDSDMEDIIFKSIPNSGYSGSSYLPTPPVSEYTCPLNSHTSATDITKCDCNVGFQINLSKTACVAIPTKTNNQICQDDFGVNVEWDGTKTSEGNLNCNCKSGYAWNTGRTACVVFVPTTEKKVTPTCSISFTPQVVELGEYVSVSHKTSGPITSITMEGTGDQYASKLLAGPNTPLVINFNNGKDYSYKVITKVIGEATETYTVTGLGGSSTCTGAYKVIPKTISKDSSKDTSNIAQEKLSTEKKITPAVEPKEEVTPPVNPEPVKKIPWYKRLFNWLFN